MKLKEADVFTTICLSTGGVYPSMYLDGSVWQGVWKEGYDGEDVISGGVAVVYLWQGVYTEVKFFTPGYFKRLQK